MLYHHKIIKFIIIFYYAIISRVRCLNILDKLTSKDLKCIPPYVKIGAQCLFFSQPYIPWGLTDSWDESYLNFYDAVAFCRFNGGDLAQDVRDFKSAHEYCLSHKTRGGCAPSLLRRGFNKCYQWSPIDGSEIEIPCRRWKIKMRFICENKKVNFKLK